MRRMRQRRCGSVGQDAKKETDMRKLLLAPIFAAAIALGAPGTAMAAPNNDQDGLVNVNLQDIAVAIPVSVAVPIGVAANLCNVNVLSLHEQIGDMTCTAENNSTALSRLSRLGSEFRAAAAELLLQPLHDAAMHLTDPADRKSVV